MNAQTVAKALGEIADEAASDLGRAPTSGELLEILAWGLRSIPDDTLEGFDPADLTGLKARYERGAKPDRDAGDVAELNDAPFTAAADFVARLARDLGKPKVEQLLQAIVEGLHEADENLVSDVKPAQVTAIEPVWRKGKRSKPKVGAVVAIPVNGEHELAVVVARNGFGTAYGLLGGTGTQRPLPKDSSPAELRHPVYADDEPVLEGRWQVVGHDEKLLERFPDEPEIFHPPRPDNPDLGKHGAAETPDGKLRKLSAEEAKEVGLDRGDFRQFYLGEDLERRLAG